MRRTLPAVLILTLAACSSGGSSSSTTAAAGAEAPAAVLVPARAPRPGRSPAVAVAPAAPRPRRREEAETAAASIRSTRISTRPIATGPSVARSSRRTPFLSATESCSSSSRIFRWPPMLVESASTQPTRPCARLATLNALPWPQQDESLHQNVPTDGRWVGRGHRGLLLPSSDCQSEDCSGNPRALCSAGTCLGVVPLGGAGECPNCGALRSLAGSGLLQASICSTPALRVGRPTVASMVQCDTGLDCINGTCVAIPVGAGNPCNRKNGGGRLS